MPLGVCLGHQGIAHFTGGQVNRARTPRRCTAAISPTTTTRPGSPASAQGFKAVRYHSLASPSSPPELEGTARTTDGVLMGLPTATADLGRPVPSRVDRAASGGDSSRQLPRPDTGPRGQAAHRDHLCAGDTERKWFRRPQRPR